MPQLLTRQYGLVSLKPLRIVICYALVGLLWVFFSDRLVMLFFHDTPQVLLRINTLKGFGFVFLTSLLLYVLLLRHVSAYRRKERELRESQERYRLVVENAPDAILLHDGDCYVFANAEALKLYGAQTADQIVGRRILDFVHDASRESVLERMRQNTAGQAVPLREQCYLRLDGTPIDVEVSAVPFVVEDANGALVFMRDISQRKAVERSLRESERRYRLLADNAYDVIFTLDPDLRLTYISPSIQKLRGLSPEEALRETGQEAMTPASYEMVTALAGRRRRAVETMDRDFVERLELEMRRKDGSTVWTESVVRLLFADDSRFLGFVGASRDISERRRAEEERQRSQNFLSKILDSIPDPVFVKDSDHRFVLANEALCAMLGHTRQDILGRQDQDFVSPQEAQVFVERDNFVLETGLEDICEEQFTDSLGQAHTLVTKKGLFGDHQGKRFIVGVTRDVTEDKRKEMRLRQSLLEKEVLLKEVHHRVKNNLQIISSLLFLQKDTIEDPRIEDLFEESRHRITSMALVHEELYRCGDLNRVDIREYLERLVPKVVQSFQGNKSLGFALHLDECRLSVDKAIPFGLIVNELVTNAVKHGFVGRDSGTIRVSVGQEGDLVRAVVADDGVGLPQGFHPDSIKSLGMQLVVQLTRQLRGALTFGAKQGSVFRLTFPLSESA